MSPVVNVPQLSGNSVRISEIIALLEGIGCEVTFCFAPISRIHGRRVGGELESYWGDRLEVYNGGKVFKGTLSQRCLTLAQRLLGRVNLLGLFSPLLDFSFADGYVSSQAREWFRDVVRRKDPDLVVVQYAVLSGLIKGLSSRAIKVVDTHDCFTDRNKRLRATGVEDRWLSLTSRQEELLLARFDVVWAIQREEAMMFSSLLVSHDSCEVETIDVTAPSLDIGVPPTNFNVGFIGSANAHNKRGIIRFIEQHWNRIRKEVPEATLNIVGAYYAEIDQLGLENIQQLGRIADIEQFYRDCSLLINPCPSGSGLKIKSLEALKYGRALVTTPEGLLGLEGAKGVAILCADLDSDDFAAACIALLQDRTKLVAMGLAGSKYVDSCYEQNANKVKMRLALI